MKSSHHRYKHYFSEYTPYGIGSDVKGTIIYVGCGVELSSLRVFRNAECYIHQDVFDPKLYIAFDKMKRNNEIIDFDIVSEEPKEREYRFSYPVWGGKIEEKTMIETWKRDENLVFVHPLADDNLNVVYFNAVPFEDIIKDIQIRLLPKLNMGGVFEGSYYNKYHYGAEPHRLGLEREGITYPKYVKVRQMSSEEIEEEVADRFSFPF